MNLFLSAAGLPGATARSTAAPADVPTPADAPSASGAPGWEALLVALDHTLAALRPDTHWLQQLLALRAQARQLLHADTDAALLQLLLAAGQDSQHYSSRHAWLCLVVATEAARSLGWRGSLPDSLGLAALTMNTSVHALQDALAQGLRPPTPAQRQLLAGHAAHSAQALQRAGVADADWVETVRLHHDETRPLAPLADLAPAQRAARLLRRVDQFTAALSCRDSRAPLSPVAAARAAALGPDGQPDEIGAALLQAVGLYPPGSFVLLAGGELAVVVARGPRANLPRVALLADGQGRPLQQPVLQDTHHQRHAVRSALSADQARVRPALADLLALARTAPLPAG